MATTTETHKVSLTKPAERQLNPKVIESNMTDLVTSVNTKSLKVRGWEVKPLDWSREDDTEEAKYLYTAFLTVEYDKPDTKAGKQDLPTILRTIYSRASQPMNGRWALTEVDGETYHAPDSGEIASSADMIGYAEVEMPEDWESNFAHLYGLDAHIARIKTAMQAGIMSNWRNRYHCALVGPPGCGKSDICQTIKRALGEDAVMEFDATAMTAAGAIKELAEREILPRVLIVEEIEKAPEAALSFLLAVCDLRGEIRKVTARSNLQRDTKLFVIATVNNVPLFDKLQAGALSSRFSNKIWFKRPGREMLSMILEREIEKIDGDMSWIIPTLDYCETKDINDPRMVTAICLCGRDMLLTGEYQRMMKETESPIEND